jgi:hypothetical protein
MIRKCMACGSRQEAHPIEDPLMSHIICSDLCIEAYVVWATTPTISELFSLPGFYRGLKIGVGLSRDGRFV